MEQRSDRRRRTPRRRWQCSRTRGPAGTDRRDLPAHRLACRPAEKHPESHSRSDRRRRSASRGSTCTPHSWFQDRWSGTRIPTGLQSSSKSVHSGKARARQRKKAAAGRSQHARSHQAKPRPRRNASRSPRNDSTSAARVLPAAGNPSRKSRGGRQDLGVRTAWRCGSRPGA